MKQQQQRGEGKDDDKEKQHLQTLEEIAALYLPVLESGDQAKMFAAMRKFYKYVAVADFGFLSSYSIRLFVSICCAAVELSANALVAL